MRAVFHFAALMLAVLMLAVLPGVAAPRHKAAVQPAAANSRPKQIGRFDDWTAATYRQNGQTVCYAFTRAKPSDSVQQGQGGAAPLLTVTERSGSRDDVAITAGFAYPKGASVTVQVDQTGLDFYTAGPDAFARDHRGAAAAFQHGAEAIARGPGPHGAKLSDAYSLKGFSAAYAAVTKACAAR